MSPELTAQRSIFDLFLTHEMTILSKGCKADNLESHSSLKLSFTNIIDFHLNFVECESFLLLTFLLLCEIKMDDSIDSGNFSVSGLSSFNPKGFCYSYSRSCSLCERRALFYTCYISRKICRLLLIFSTGFTSFSVLLPFPPSITLLVFAHSF